MSFAIGRYVPYNSFLHRMDPRAKIMATIFLMVAVFMNYPNWSMRLLMGCIIFLFLCVLLYVSRMSLRSILSSLRPLWFTLVFLLLIYIAVPQQNNTLGIAWDLNGWVVYWDSFAEAFRIIMRFVMTIMLTMILTATTKPLDLTYAVEWYLSPLKVFNFPAAEIAMMLSIALRFIPTLLEDSDRIMKAQASRGVDFKHGRIMARITGITSLIIPLFVSSFMRSEDLAEAMECRGYDPRAKRSRYRKLSFSWGSLAGLMLCAAIMAGFITISAMRIDFFALMGLSVK